MTELWRNTASTLAAMVRDGSVSAREVAVDALARLDAVNPAINAVIDHRPEEVLAQAAAIDARLAAGEEIGPLGGVPVTVKVNTDQVGFATTNGLALQKDLIATQDSPVVANLRRAGAVLLGRTNTPAFSLRWFTTNQLHGVTKNPRDAGLTPGGSSGGAAASVAAGIGALAHGTDIGGSIRYPAYACGVHGIRPSLGRVPAWNRTGAERGIGPQVMAVSGPIGRTIADLRLGLTAMAAADARDPWHIPMPLVGPPVAKRVALCLRPNGMAIAPEIETALKQAAHRLAQAGWTVEELDDTPSFREATELQVQLWLGDGFEAFLANAEREGDPEALFVLGKFRDLARAMPADVVARAMTRRATLTRVFQMFLADYPVLLVPVSGQLPFAQNQDQGSPAVLDAVWEAQLIQTGLPLMSLPGLVVSTGLVGTAPVGVQLIGQRWREDVLFDAASVIEAGGVPPAPIDPRV
jgi:amidase